ncbi:MAG: molybdopterin-dependent oxidoreductase [Hyphomonadaceae bacterium]
MAGLTTCPYCGVGCGVSAEGARDAARVSGDESHPANGGRLCSKGSALGETVGLDGRLLYPMLGRKRTTWAQATRIVAQKFRSAIEAHGPESVAFYVSGQLLTEDYYAANKLMKGFIGSGNIDTNSRLCMASAVTAHKLSFGEDVVPGCYEDLEIADLIVFSGHNAAWTHPVLYRRMEAARASGQRHVVIDPRATDTARDANLHLQIKSQTDVRLWNGLLAFLWETGAIDRRFIAARTEGFEAVRTSLEADDQTIPAIARDCGLEGADVAAFYRAFAKTARTVTLFSQGANQSKDGVAKGLSIINAHLATGRVSRPGASPFSITGQPNAMGGRETGGMANTLAAHLEFTPADVDCVGRFWRARHMATRPGLKAVDMFDAVADGRIKALWIMATNPAVSMPDAERVRAALKACPFVVVSDIIADTDTSKFAHVRLPALAWGEKDGTVTNSERCISRQRAFLPPPGAARPDWRIISDVAAAMGHAKAFSYRGPADIFREYAALTGFENDGARVLDISAAATLSDAHYDALSPARWPFNEDGGVDRPFETRAFPTSSGKARFEIAAQESRARDIAFPLVLNTGRNRDQWHTMTRTGLSPRLMRHAPEPTLDLHPRDATAHGVIDGALAEVRTPYGRAILRARVTEDVRAGEVFAPMHWTDQFAPQARANALVSPEVDARSGQPEFKHTPARVGPAPVAWRAFLVSRAPIEPPNALWWRRIPQDAGELYEISAAPGAMSADVAAALLFQDLAERPALSARDSAGSFIRMAALREGRLERAFFATRGRGLPPREWLCAQLGAERLEDEDRRLLLAGGPLGDTSYSPCVCACFNVCRDAIEAFARTEPGANVARVAAQLKAGGNCGSCRPAIAQILASLKENESAAA